MKLTPKMTSMGVRIDDIDLSKPISQPQFATILSALGKYGVVWFPKQTLDARALKAFSELSMHPIFLTHPITGRKVVYANPGYTVRINEFDQAESDRILRTYSVTACSRSTSMPTTGAKATC